MDEGAAKKALVGGSAQPVDPSGPQPIEGYQPL